MKKLTLNYSRFAIYELIPCIGIKGNICEIDERFICATDCANEAAQVVQEEQAKCGNRVIIRERKFEDNANYFIL